MIQVENLSKSYEDFEALKAVSFEIKAGEIVGLLGPNGAGKTTLIKTLTGYHQPSAGTVLIDGLDVLSHAREIQAKIGYLPENAPLYPELSVQNYLLMMADLRQIPADMRIGRIKEAIQATSLQAYLTSPISTLSKGYRQRVGLAQAILHQPDLLILDEPTVGLDPTQIVEIRGLIQRLAEHSTILFSTHILSEVEALCNRVMILMNGQLKLDSHLADLSTSQDAILCLQDAIPDVANSLQNLPQVSMVETSTTPEGYPQYYLHAKADVCPAVYDLARANNWPLRELKRNTETLESIFNQLATEVR